MTNPEHGWTWVGRERTESIRRVANWSQVATSAVAVLALTACVVSSSGLPRGAFGGLVVALACITVVCLVFAAVAARALPQVASAGFIDIRRSRRFVTFLVFLCVTSWLFGVVLTGLTTAGLDASPVPLVAGVAGSVLLTVIAVRTASIARPRAGARST